MLVWVQGGDDGGVNLYNKNNIYAVYKIIKIKLKGGVTFEFLKKQRNKYVLKMPIWMLVRARWGDSGVVVGEFE